MNAPQSHKMYASAKGRFLGPGIEQFFAREFPKLFGPLMRAKIAQSLLQLIQEQLPPKTHLRSGQMLWNAVSVKTRPDHPRRQLVPVILTLVHPQDVRRLAQGESHRQLAQEAVARLTREAFGQGALLSMRDIGLFIWRHAGVISRWRQQWEKHNQQILPHPGSLQDFGSCVSHKELIVRKAVLEGKDPAQVALETRHTQEAVDRYLRDFSRVRLCYEHHFDSAFISQATGLSPHVVRQYLQILHEINNLEA